MPTMCVRLGIVATPDSPDTTLTDLFQAYSEVEVDGTLEYAHVVLGPSENFTVPLSTLACLTVLAFGADRPMMVTATSGAGVAQAFPASEELAVISTKVPFTSVSITGPGVFFCAVGGLVNLP